MEKIDFNKIKKDIMFSEILIDSHKDEIMKQLKSKLIDTEVSRSTWFEVKMILYKHRYHNIDKDKFFDWLNSTYLFTLFNEKEDI